MTDPYELGEDRHMRCRYGDLTGAISVSVDALQRAHDDGREVPFEAAGTLPLCRWRPPEASPPALSRAWGGLVEFERDCAVCKAFSELKEGDGP